MKTKFYFLMSLLALFFTINSFSQEIVEKKFFSKENKFGGEVILKNAILNVDGSKTYKIFEFDVPYDGLYFLNTWIMGIELNDFGSGKLLSYELYINGGKQPYIIKPEKSNWHNLSLKDNKTGEKITVKLNKGLNRIAFSCDAPNIPELDFIRLSRDSNKSEISEKSYNQFIDDIKVDLQKGVRYPEPEGDTSSIEFRSGQVLDNPAGNYYHKVNVNFRYTTYKQFYFSAGQQVFFTTYAPSGYYHVMEVFNRSNPENYSWVDLSNSSGLASLNINIPSTGYYYIRIRSYYQETQGLVNLNVNGQYYYTDCPVSGSGLSTYHDHNTTYNYFTCFLTGDSRIWINDTQFPGKIRAFNDDYYGSGDFSWGYSSRVKKHFNVNISGPLVSSYSSYNPLGKCDIYYKCQNSTIMPYFPNLKDDDAIQSAPASNSYNCISWSGGITWYWEWPQVQLHNIMSQGIH